MSNSITAFKDAFNGGTRSNRFIVIPEWPTEIGQTDADASFKIISASLPAVQINTISIPYRGRLINFAGDRQYSPWTIGVYDDNNSQSLWRSFQRWKELIDGHYTHKVTTTNNDFTYQQYQKTWTIKHLDVNSNQVLRTIYLYKCWPSIVGEIRLDMGESNFVAFNVTLVYDNLRIQEINQGDY
jgi:hypothetical protein